MTKAELIASIAAKAGISKDEARRALEAFVEAVQDSLSKGSKVTIRGFGTFSVTRRESRIGRNPQTGREIEIPSKNVVRFKGTGDGGPRRK